MTHKDGRQEANLPPVPAARGRRSRALRKLYTPPLCSRVGSSRVRRGSAFSFRPSICFSLQPAAAERPGRKAYAHKKSFGRNDRKIFLKRPAKKEIPVCRKNASDRYFLFSDSPFPLLIRPAGLSLLHRAPLLPHIQTIRSSERVIPIFSCSLKEF